MWSHQKFKVYGKALAVAGSLAKHSAAWNKGHGWSISSVAGPHRVDAARSVWKPVRVDQFAVKFAVKFNHV